MIENIFLCGNLWKWDWPIARPLAKENDAKYKQKLKTAQKGSEIRFRVSKLSETVGNTWSCGHYVQ
jgi:hypothetical protein